MIGMKSPLFLSTSSFSLTENQDRLKYTFRFPNPFIACMMSLGWNPKDLDCVSIHSVGCVTEWFPGIRKLVP